MIDEGTYNLTGDITLLAAQSGITIEGYNNPSFPTRVAVLNRGNTTSGNVFYLNGAQNVTLDHLSLTGALYGVSNNYNVANPNDTVSNCVIYGIASVGIYMPLGDAGFTLTGCTFHDNYNAMEIDGSSNVTITNNVSYNASARGISVSSTGGTISGNTVYNIGGVAGIEAYGGQGATLTVSNNVSHDNGGPGIIVGNYVLATGNTAYNQSGSSNIGIEVEGGEARGNASPTTTTTASTSAAAWPTRTVSTIIPTPAFASSTAPPRHRTRFTQTRSDYSSAAPLRSPTTSSMPTPLRDLRFPAARPIRSSTTPSTSPPATPST